jgi:hypothetical protein
LGSYNHLSICWKKKKTKNTSVEMAGFFMISGALSIKQNYINAMAVALPDRVP